MKTYSDLTQDKTHVIGKLVDLIHQALPNATLLDRTSELVAVHDNYDALGYAKDAVCRLPQYAHYVDATTMYRTQMTSQVPGLLRNLSANSPTDVSWLIPGIVYRRDVTDRYHVPAPHQMDVWMVSNTRTYTVEDLHTLIKTVLYSVLPNVKYRVNPTSHTYTDNGLEVEVYYNDRWVELLECGLAGRTLLDNHGLTSYTGLALGIGLDRLAMLLKQLPDIRLLRDSSVQEQMSTLLPYVAESIYPTITRDISVAMPNNTNLEDICETLGTVDTNNWVADVEILSITPYSTLHPKAIVKLGMSIDHSNYLIRVTLQSLNKTLSMEETNHWYSAAYKALHKGSNWTYLLQT